MDSVKLAPMAWSMKWKIGLFILLNVVDAFLSEVLLVSGGVELNPILRNFPVGVWLGKVVLMIPLVVLISMFRHASLVQRCLMYVNLGLLMVDAYLLACIVIFA